MLSKAMRHELIAFIGEYVGTSLFLYFAFMGVKVAKASQPTPADDMEYGLTSQSLIYISAGFGLSLLVVVWMFYRVTGGAFNPAVTLTLYLAGACPALRAIVVFVAQMLGGMTAAALTAALTPDYLEYFADKNGAGSFVNSLSPHVNLGQGLFIEAFGTFALCFCVLMTAAEKQRATFVAPIPIGITLMLIHMICVNWTGCGVNPARSFGPSVVAHSFPVHHWIYWVGPLIGSLLATGLYITLKALDYTEVSGTQDDAVSDGVLRTPFLGTYHPHVYGGSASDVEAALEARANGIKEPPSPTNGDSTILPSQLGPNSQSVGAIASTFAQQQRKEA